MRPGQLRQRVTIESLTETQTADGVQQSWSTVETRWAQVKRLDSESAARYQQMYPDTTHFVLMRGDATVSFADHRLQWDGDVLEFTGPPRDPDGTGEMIVAEAKVGDA